MKRENNFDIVRLLLAGTVVLFHAATVSAQPRLAHLPKLFSGSLAVQGFFAISGFLIFASYERALSLSDYVVKRAARILPGYWLATVVALCIAFSFGCFHVGHFLLANLSFANFLSPSIPGLFQNNPVTLVNGALWTIKVELMFYVAVPIIVWLGNRMNRDAVLVAVLIASLIYRYAVGEGRFAEQLPGQLSFFMVGALIYYHVDAFYRYGKYLAGIAAVMITVHEFTHWFFLRPLSIPVLTLAAALLLPVVKGPTRWGDFSYGIYVLHWPVIQTLTAAGLYARHAWLALLATLAIVATGAVISWFSVEKPALTFAHTRMRSKAQQQREIQPA